MTADYAWIGGESEVRCGHLPGPPLPLRADPPLVEGPLQEWVQLNPSNADAPNDDPSTDRCVGFARHCGFAGTRVTNLFTLVDR